MAAKKSAIFVVALVIALVVGAFGAYAFAAEDPYGEGKPRVQPTLTINEGNPEPEVLNDRTPDFGDRTQGAALPFTGADLTAFVLIGASAVATGAFVVRRTRRAEAR